MTEITSAKYISYNGKNDNIQATINGVECFVPIDENNSHYQAIQEWVKAGNTIEEAD
tara:strand:+ start:99 stop:269 length:171 start_codon:yes stop_codon:yes gene_type:complete